MEHKHVRHNEKGSNESVQDVLSYYSTFGWRLVSVTQESEYVFNIFLSRG